MKNIIYNAFLAILAAGSVLGATDYVGPVFDLFDDSATTNANAANWTNGTPGAGNDGTISIDYNFATLGAADNGNVNPLPSGVFSVTQSSGDGTGGQFNLAGNPNFTFNLNGGSITSTSGIFFVNSHTFNLAGGAISVTGEMRVGSGGDLVVSSGSITAGSLTLQNAGSTVTTSGGNTTFTTITVQTSGALTVSAGSITTTNFLVRGGTVELNGGSFTSNAPSIIFNRNSGSTASTIGLSGGTLSAASATSLLNNTDLAATIGGSFSATMPLVTNLFNGGNHAASSSINFTSGWTGSLTLDSATAWDAVFEAGDVSVDGVELGPGAFETYFVNNSGVITMIPTTITITACGFDASGNYFIDVAEGVAGLKVTTSPDLVVPFADATGVTDDGVNRFTISAGSLDSNADGKDFFRVETQ